MRVVLASANQAKLREMRALLAPLGLELIGQTELGVQGAEETGATFIDNARIKACHAAVASGLAAIADDSGIEVDALGGRPGVYSARYAGPSATDEENVRRLLHELREVPPARRGARYRCSIVFARSPDDPSPLVTEGVWEGHITHAPRGAGGFGYDPVFVPTGLDVTAAQLPAEVKNSLSHRGQALRALQAQLRAWMDATEGRDT
jgi:XTP/dITP diphosphohydrolase